MHTMHFMGIPVLYASNFAILIVFPVPNEIKIFQTQLNNGHCSFVPRGHHPKRMWAFSVVTFCFKGILELTNSVCSASLTSGVVKLTIYKLFSCRNIANTIL